jgi:hypothetical protein
VRSQGCHLARSGGRWGEERGEMDLLSRSLAPSIPRHGRAAGTRDDEQDGGQNGALQHVAESGRNCQQAGERVQGGNVYAERERVSVPGYASILPLNPLAERDSHHRD